MTSVAAPGNPWASAPTIEPPRPRFNPEVPPWSEARLEPEELAIRRACAAAGRDEPSPTPGGMYHVTDCPACGGALYIRSVELSTDGKLHWTPIGEVLASCLGCGRCGTLAEAVRWEKLEAKRGPS